MARVCPCWPYMVSSPRYWSLLDRIETLEERNLRLLKELQRLKRSSSPMSSKDYSAKTTTTKSYKNDDLDVKPQRGSPSTLSRPAYVDYLPENRYNYPTPIYFPVAPCDHPPLTRKKLPEWQIRDRTPTPLAPAEHRPVRPARSKTPVPTSKGLLSPQRSSDYRESSRRASPSPDRERFQKTSPDRERFQRTSPDRERFRKTSPDRERFQKTSPRSSISENKGSSGVKSQRREFDDFIEIDTYRSNEPNVPCCRTLMPSPHPMNPKVPLMPTPELENKMDSWVKNSTRLLKVTGGDQSAGRASSPWNFPLETSYGSSSDDQQFAKLAGFSALHSNAVDQLKSCY